MVFLPIRDVHSFQNYFATFLNCLGSIYKLPGLISKLPGFNLSFPRIDVTRRKRSVGPLPPVCLWFDFIVWVGLVPLFHDLGLALANIGAVNPFAAKTGVNTIIERGVDAYVNIHGTVFLAGGFVTGAAFGRWTMRPERTRFTHPVPTVPPARCHGFGWWRW
jgi:hypothetical protein